MPHAGEHHGDAVLIGGGDHLVVAHAAAGLDDGLGARLRECVEAIAEGEECIGGHRRAGEREFRALRLGCGDAHAVDPAHLAGTDAERRAVAAEHDRIRLYELGDAPRVEPEALQLLGGKSNLRVLEVPLARESQPHDYKRIGGGLLVQSSDMRLVERKELRVATRRQPSEQEWGDLLFAWRVAKFVKSNAIVFCQGGATLGVGAGQMSRVDSVRIAALKAQGAKLSLAGSAVASDAFFPFRDGLDALAQAGAKAVIQPGGSLRDDEVIKAADEHGIAMVFTGVRHFRH